MDENEALVELLEEVLGDHGLHYPNHGQISFNCPVCDEGRNKYNLEVNYVVNVYKCWACGDSEGTHGPLGRIFDKYGNKKQKKLRMSKNQIPPDVCHKLEKIKEKKIQKMKRKKGKKTKTNTKLL